MQLGRLTLATLALVVAGSAANAQIANSRHNFSSYGWSGGEICKPCHTPHFGNADAGALWNHALTTATYTMFEGEQGTAELNLDRSSRLCLSCHDGTVALDSFGGMTGTNFIGPAGNVGTDLQDDHPIGSDAVYPTTSTRFNPPDSTGSRVGSLRLGAWNDNGTTKYVVGCSTCHQVHAAGGFPHMLRMSNSSSALCLACHIK